jgi:tetratricopeptide (TPR) repeat protein
MIRALAALVFLCGGLADEVFAAGGGPKKAEEPSPQQQAIEHYNKGLKHRDKAWQHEAKAATAEKEKDREKRLKKARKDYEKAVTEQLSAVDNNPRFHEAFSSLGYAYRKLDRYEEALAAYGTCLELAPNYAEAIEYRGEAYLGLNRVAEARQAYESLLTADRAHAASLLSALKEWTRKRRVTPVEGVSAGTLAEVEEWIAVKETAAANGDEVGESDTPW